MARVLFNDLPEPVKYDIIKKYMGTADGDNDSNIKELLNVYTDIFSKNNYAIGGFSDDFIKKNNLKPYTRMLYPGQLNRLQKIKDAYKTGEITSQDDFLDMLKDFISAEAPEVYDKENAEETDALRQFKREVYADTPWEEYKLDANGDGDADVTIIDTNDNGKPDTAIITADSEKEQRDAIKAVKDKLNIDKQTSTGKTKKELDNQTLSDVRQKNVLKALLDCRF